MLHLLDALHLGPQTFRDSSTIPRSGRLSWSFFQNSPAITLSTNNRISLCSYYIQLSATLLVHLCTIVGNVVRLSFECPKLLNTKTRRRYTLLLLPTSQIRELKGSNQDIEWQHQVLWLWQFDTSARFVDMVHVEGEVLLTVNKRAVTFLKHVLWLIYILLM